MAEKLLTTQELSTLLGRPIRTLEHDRYTGAGVPYVKVGPRNIRYRQSDVDAWLSGRTFASRAAELAGRPTMVRKSG